MTCWHTNIVEDILTDCLKSNSTVPALTVQHDVVNELNIHLTCSIVLRVMRRTNMVGARYRQVNF